MTEEQKTAAPGPSGNQPPINLDEVDNLLNELDPDFRAHLGDLTSQIETISVAGLESVSLSADYLKDSSEAKSDDVLTTSVAEPKAIVESKPKNKIHIVTVLGGFLLSTLWLPMSLSQSLFRLYKMSRQTSAMDALKKAPSELGPVFQLWLSTFKNFTQKLGDYSFSTYVKLALIIILSVVIKYILVDMKAHILPDGFRDPFLKTWAEVSDGVHEIPADELDDTIENPQKHPEYTVLIHRIVSNLKTSTPKHTPMVTSELYIEASNQDCAIELHDRELEVRDTLERVFEDTTFDELDTTPGKERVKIKIRTALNRFLTKGHVKRIFFSSLNMVP